LEKHNKYNDYWNQTWGICQRITKYVGKRLKRCVKHTYLCLLHGLYENITGDSMRLRCQISKENYHNTTSGTTTRDCGVLRSMRYLHID